MMSDTLDGDEHAYVDKVGVFSNDLFPLSQSHDQR